VEDDDLDAEYAALLRQSEFSKQRLPIEQKAREAEASGDLAQAAVLWKQSLELASQSGDDFSRWYVEGQLARVLIDSERIDEAKTVLEAGLAAGNDIPFAHRLLANLHREDGAYLDAYRVQHASWMRTSERAQGNGMPRLDPSPQIVALAKWWKDAGSEEPLILAEKWANEAQVPDALFAVRHERAQWLESKDDIGPALALYLALIEQRTKHEATYSRALMLLDRLDRADDALALAQRILGAGLSASLEERARKRIESIEKKRAKQKSPRTKRTPSAEPTAKQPKAQIPAFSIRSGELLRWVNQTEVKGGISSIVATQTGVFATGGKEPALWWIANGASEPARLRSIPKRTHLYLGSGTALVSDDGTVAQGSARVELLGTDWAPTAVHELPGVTSEVAVASWGLAIGCRAGGLYSIGWNGQARWRFDVPKGDDASGLGAACPYFVSSAPEIGTVVFSSFSDAYALSEAGQVMWKWRLPTPPAHDFGGLISIQMPAASVSAVRATRDGGAWVASQAGGMYRINGSGKLLWSGSSGGNTSQLLTNGVDELVAVGHSDGVALMNTGGQLTNVLSSKRWPRVARSPDGHLLTVSEGKLLQVLDARGQVLAVAEFSKPISEAAIVGNDVIVAAGKLVRFAVDA
jgi:hypothetical protein